MARNENLQHKHKQSLFLKKKAAIPLILLFLVLCIPGVLGLLHFADDLRDERDLIFHIEGFAGRTNFRDLGQSINACVGNPLLTEDLLYRAKRQFSGLPCSLVGSPDKIYSLNHVTGSEKSYYCRQANLKPHFGIHLNTKLTLQDLEFYETWESKPEMAVEACKFISAITKDAMQKSTVLFHCDAGRDRTGALSALFAGLALEKITSHSAVIDAAACDYHKSKNLPDSFKPRIQNFLKTAYQNHGSIQKFLIHFCKNTNKEELDQFADLFLNKGSSHAPPL